MRTTASKIMPTWLVVQQLDEADNNGYLVLLRVECLRRWMRFLIRSWVNNYIDVKEWDVITHPYPNFNGCLVKPPLKSGHEWLVISNALQWRHTELDGVANHQPHDRLFNRLFGHRLKKTSKLCVTGLCVGNSPVTGEFPTQRARKRKMFPFDYVIM